MSEINGVKELESRLSESAKRNLDVQRSVYEHQDAESLRESIQTFNAQNGSPESTFAWLKQRADNHPSDVGHHVAPFDGEKWDTYAAMMLAGLEVVATNPELAEIAQPEHFLQVLQLISDHVKNSGLKIGEKLKLFGSPAQLKIDCATFLEMGKILIANQSKLEPESAPVSAPVSAISHLDLDDGPLGQHGQGVKVS